MSYTPRFRSKGQKRMIPVATFAVAILLSIMPWPVWAEPFRPDWVGLVLIYWCLTTPERINVGVGWVLGLTLDILYGSLLGQHALALSLLAFVVVKFHLQLRMFPRWQQSVTVLVLLGVAHLLILWVRGATGQAPGTWAYWLPAIVSAFLWPWVFAVLRDVRRRADIT